jgi:hypothetical protein
MDITGARLRDRMVSIFVGWDGREGCVDFVAVSLALQVLVVVDIGKPGLTYRSCGFASETDRSFVRLASGTVQIYC